MNPLYPVAQAFAELAREKGWRCALVGGLAVGRWGKPRATDDVDFSLWVELGDERECIDAILQRFPGRGSDVVQLAMSSRILLVMGQNDVELDVIMASFDFESPLFDRATEYEFAPGIRVPTVSADDLVYLKACANRDQDWVDIKSVIIAQGPALNWNLIESQLNSIRDVIAYDEIMPRLRTLREKHGATS